MTYTYEKKNLATVGETISVPDGDMFVGTHLEADGKGGFRVVAHILRRQAEVVTLAPSTEFRQ